MKLIVGLGNPGSQYERTRHNAGFMAVERFARKHNAGNWRVAHEGFVADTLLDPGGVLEKVILLRPMTFMNLSGRSVASALQFYRIAVADLLVVVDDVALPCGAIRLRAAGSSGGHNGLTDIERAIGSFAAAEGRAPLDYSRLRIGIDAPGLVPQKNYVLEAFSGEQLPKLEVALNLAVDAMACWISDGIVTAMNRFNESKKDSQDENKDP